MAMGNKRYTFASIRESRQQRTSLIWEYTIEFWCKYAKSKRKLATPQILFLVQILLS